MNPIEAKWLTRLSETPFDTESRCSYADWLDKRGATRKAEMLRLSAEQIRLYAKERESRGRLPEPHWSHLRKLECRLLELSYRVEPRWVAMIDPSLAIPPGLSDLGLRVARLYVEFVGEERWEYSGYGQVFALPSDGPMSDDAESSLALLVVHYTDEMDRRINADDDASESLDERLAKVGVWAEPYDGVTWVVYPSDYPGYSIGLDYIQTEQGAWFVIRPGRSGGRLRDS